MKIPQIMNYTPIYCCNQLLSFLSGAHALWNMLMIITYHNSNYIENVNYGANKNRCVFKKPKLKSKLKTSKWKKKTEKKIEAPKNKRINTIVYKMQQMFFFKKKNKTIKKRFN